MEVGDQFRKNELSIIPGGTSITVKYSNGKTLTYTKIKNIDAYLKRVIKDPLVLEIWNESKLIWKTAILNDR